MKTFLTEYEKNEHSKDFRDICFYTLYKDGYSYYLKFVLAPVRYDNGMIFTGCKNCAIIRACKRSAKNTGSG